MWLNQEIAGCEAECVAGDGFDDCIAACGEEPEEDTHWGQFFMTIVSRGLQLQSSLWAILAAAVS